MSLIRLIKNSYYYKYIIARLQRISVRMNPRKEMNRVYFKVYHKYPNLDNPQNLIEKIFWLQLHSDTSMWTKCADKFAMREYVKECGLAEYLPKNYGMWSNIDDISFDSLPDEYVLKTNNGCGTVLVMTKERVLDKSCAKRQLKRWLSIPYGWSGAQLHYTRISPSVIAEELLHQDEEYDVISPGSLMDFKIWCLNGEPESVFVAYNRHEAMMINTALYDTQWNSISQYLQNTKNDVYISGVNIPKPKCFQEMLEIARILAKPFPEVRVDLYSVKGKPVIGELTFTTGFGYFTDEYYEYLGGKINISNIKKVK